MNQKLCTPRAIRWDRDVFGTVFSVCAALLRGQSLHGGEEAMAPAWGIVDCKRALGALSADSDAWHRGMDGAIHRWTREEAEVRAKRLTGSSWDGSECAAAEIPQRPVRGSAGRHCLAVPGEEGLFECVDWSNGPADVVVVGSAFDAALAFVRLVGERAALEATEHDQV